jgi:hypothetical protein
MASIRRRYCLRSGSADPRPSRTKHAILRDQGLARHLDIHCHYSILHHLEHGSSEQATTHGRHSPQSSYPRILRLHRRALGHGPTVQRQRYMDQVRRPQRMGQQRPRYPRRHPRSFAHHWWIGSSCSSRRGGQGRRICLAESHGGHVAHKLHSRFHHDRYRVFDPRH